MFIFKKMPVDKSVEPSVIAKGTPGFFGADLANLWEKEAAILVQKKTQKNITSRKFDFFER
ncbi:MAG: hypothetical protein CM15mP31_5360 [Gammaproteobacteria bacterium]|nr:MAG: hypothetical protein CM15mP31_5360 [Gammaproteobacteria bacterium]